MEKILIVDDEPDIVDMYKTKLEQVGYTVVTASNGNECLGVAKKEHPDLILLDIIMPNVNGFDVLKMLKETPETKFISVFMTTNLPENTSGEKAQSLGAIDYIVKAENEPAMLAEKIQKYFAQRNSVTKSL